MKRQFILTLNYKNENTDWDVVSHEVIEAKSLTELVTKFNLIIVSLHRVLLEEVRIEYGIKDDDEIPF